VGALFASALAAAAAASAALATLATLGPLAPATAFAATTGAARAAPPTILPSSPPISRAGGVITRSAHVSFEGCGARHITLRVSIAKDPFPVGLPVTYEVSLTNSGTTPCGPTHTALPQLHQALNVGPCGALSAVVSDAAGHDVYPGQQVFSCPMLSAVHLGAHATISTEGSWMGYEALTTPSGGSLGAVQWRKAPPGQYRVIVGNAVSVPFRLSGTPTAPSLPAPAPLPTPTVPTPAQHLPTPTTPTTSVG
jgi:hypothetical protein